MTRDDIRHAVVNALTRVAPEIDPAALQADTVMREEFELDSMDFLNFVSGLHATLGIDVPETDYGRLSTLRGSIDYLEKRLQAGAPRS